MGNVMNKEKMQHHITHLQQLHDAVDKQVEKIYKEYGNDVTVQQLKKKKLKLKDEIESCKKEIKHL